MIDSGGTSTRTVRHAAKKPCRVLYRQHASQSAGLQEDECFSETHPFVAVNSPCRQEGGPSQHSKWTYPAFPKLRRMNEPGFPVVCVSLLILVISFLGTLPTCTSGRHQMVLRRFQKWVVWGGTGEEYRSESAGPCKCPKILGFFKKS